MTSAVKTWYEYAVQQIAAESYLDRQASLVEILTDGNNDRRVVPGDRFTGTTRLTPIQAQAFVDRYQIVDHHPNDASGFSATLLYDIQTRQYTLSFRSSEYRLPRDGGDFNRDVLGADLEISKFGFAIGQLASMERYYANLAAGKTWDGTQKLGLSAFRDHLAANGQFNVSGYSLGGHLATVFTEMHMPRVSSAYIFNAAGRGRLSGDAASLVAYYQRVLELPESATGIFRNETYHKAMALRGTAFGTDLYLDPRHQWAVYATAAQFKTTAVTIFSHAPGLGNGADAKIVHVYGHATHGDREYVANSGVHTSNKVSVFIEDQPDIQGLIGHAPVFPQFMNHILVGKGDYGTTHSLALLIDSLALMGAIQSKNPALNEGAIGQIFAASTNERARGELGTGNGVAEASSLESVLDALRKLFSGGPVTETLVDSREGGFSNFQNRSVFHANLTTLQGQLNARPQAVIERAEHLDAATLAEKARADIGYRYTLKELTPFVVSGDASLYLPHNTAGALNLYGLNNPYTQFTSEYLADRSELLVWKNRRNVDNAAIFVRVAGAPSIDFKDLTSSLDLRLRGTSKETAAVVPRIVIFGSDAHEAGAAAIIGGSRDDHLYGGGGGDTLLGGEGKDYLQGDMGRDTLEGGKGDDTLVGGEGDDILKGGTGIDTYVIGVGRDTIFDDDGRGLVWDTSGRRLAGRFTKQGAQYVFLPDPTIVATRNSPLTIFLPNGASVVLEDFDDLDFGIKLFEQPAIPVTTAPILNGTAISDTLSAPPPPTGSSDTTGRMLNGLAGNDLVRGGAFGDVVDGGIGHDYLTGGTGDDYFIGGDGRDFIVLGAGRDYAEGGADDDFFGYWGYDVTPVTTLAVGGWPFYYGTAFQWHAVINKDPTSGYLLLTDLGVSTQPWTSTILGITVGGERLPLPSYAFDTTNTDSHTVLAGLGNDIVIAGPNADTLLGDDGNDILLGMQGDDTILGGAGDDRMAGNVGRDYLEGGAGADTLEGEDGGDTLFGGPGADILQGDVHLATASSANHGDDYLDGGDGDDMIVGYGGADTLFGGEGADILHGDLDSVGLAFQGADYLDGEGGNDLLIGYAGDDELKGGAGLDDLRGGAGNDRMDGEADDDVLWGEAGNDEMSGGAGNDRLAGGADADYLDGDDGVDQLWGEAGADTLVGGAGADALDGGVDDDSLYGGAGADMLVSAEGSDVLSGGADADMLVGGVGNDTYLFGPGDGQDRIDEIASAAETNVLDLEGVMPSGVKVAWGSNGSDLVFSLDGSTDQITALNWYRAMPAGAFIPPTAVATIGEVHFADGTVWDLPAIASRLYVPTEAGDVITGLATDDRISGGGGRDNLSGGYGDDVVSGGEGDDTVGDGSGSNILYGGEGADILGGGGTTTVFDGGTGNDQLFGGTGSDVYVFGLGYGIDTIQEPANAFQTDTVVFGPGIGPEDIVVVFEGTGDLFALAIRGTQDKLIFDGGGPSGLPVIERALFENGVTWTAVDIKQRLAPTPATAGNDFIRGTPLNDWISAGNGDDKVEAGDGDDIIDGGTGNDQLFGGKGSDTYLVGRNQGYADSIVDASSSSGDSSLNTIRFGPGIAQEDVRLSEYNGSLIVRLGSSIDTTTVMNWLNQEDHRGTLQFVFEGGVTWDSATIVARTARPGPTAGGDLLYGTPGADTINALGGVDSIHGGEGDDRLDGAEGDDILRGDSGNDILNGGEGSDQLLGGAGADTLSAGAGSDWLLGGSGADTLSGGPGDDRLYGEAGDDVFLFGYGGGRDSIRNDGNPGQDFDTDIIRFDDGISPQDVTVATVGAEFVLSLPSGEAISIDYRESFRVLFSGGAVWNLNGNPAGIINGTTAADSLSGTAFDDTINGLAGDDTIRGNAGLDVLDGGAGNDTLDRTAGDTVVFGHGYGRDEVRGSGVGTISFKSDVSPQQVVLRGVRLEDGTGSTEPALSITLTDSTDSLLLRGWFSDFAPDNTIDSFRFVNAPAWDLAQIRARIQLTGTAGLDYLSGTSAADVLSGLQGNDVLLGRDGNDTLSGGAGSDQLDGGSGNDVIDGGPDADVLAESFGDDRYLFSRGFGKDTLSVNNAAGGYDRIEFDSTIGPQDVVVSVAGQDLKLAITGTQDELVLSRWLDPLVRTIEEVRFGGSTTVWNAATLAAKAMPGSSANELMQGSSLADTLDGLAGNDRIEGFDGNDHLLGSAGDDQLSGDDDDDVLDGGSGKDRLYGGTGNDTLLGGSEDDYVNASFGNDLLDGGTGADRMLGGPGNDVYVIDDVRDVADESDGGGLDSVQSSIAYVLEDELENLTLTGTATIDGTGNALDNTLIGNAATNILIGSFGNDTLYGREGADVMQGGAGDDTYGVESVGDIVTESPGEGVDRVQTSISYTLGPDVETLILLGAMTINGTGNALDNELRGNGGANTLDGKAGADRMFGGAGHDHYVIDQIGDVVIENPNEGGDTVWTPLTHTLAVNVDHLMLVGTGTINGTGNAADNTLTGNAAGNVLTGLAGHDRLDGGAGADSMFGGIGDDVYVVDNALDAVTEALAEGVDTVQSSVTYTLAPNVEKLVLTGSGVIDGTGNTLDNTLTGNAGTNTLSGQAGNDFLDGGGGSDALWGGAGDDMYVVDGGDTVTENPNEGTDTARASVSYTLGANVENLLLIGTAPIDGSGNELNNVLEGNVANNRLTGGAGNDALRGYGGTDTMAGGTGDDAYSVHDTTDVIIENVNEGVDAVWATASYTLHANVENLTLWGSAAIDGRGNPLSNVITGNAANNLLDGGAGADRMAGGAGDDSYVVDDAGDLVTENPNEGTDLVQSAISYTLGANVERLTLVGSAAINGTGNALDNVLTGNSASNVLTGLAGNDVYVVDGGDIVTENPNGGSDTVQSGATYTLSANLENLTLVGTAAINGTGNDLDNALVGNSANNVLSGAAGNDTLNGMAGTDTLAGGSGNDIYVVDSTADAISENLNDGTDIVQSSATYALGANVENLTLTGAAAVNGTGNALDNRLTGNAASNALMGNAGNDLLDGLAGADTMMGGTGNDLYAVDQAGDVVTEKVNEGTDTVESAVDAYTLSADVEDLTLIGPAISGTGNNLANTLTGNAAANVLVGREGDDVLRGMAGADAMAGGSGNDAYSVDHTGDVITENLNEGTDSVWTAVTHTLAVNVENLALTGTAAIDGGGNALDNALTGNSANNVLNGFAGADWMAGGAGNDTYHVDHAGDVVLESADAGIDVAQSSVSHTLAPEVESLVLTGTGAINGSGNALNNALTGNNASNVLDGKAGADTMSGGLGDDSYVVDVAGDIVTEGTNSGTDTVQAALTYTLGANLENLALTGVAAINGTGNAVDNMLTGNAAPNVLTGLGGHDRLDGGAGADSMLGGTGDDVYIVDNSGDAVTEALAEGVDTVQSSITYTLGANVERLALTGTGVVDGTGNTLDNTLTGNTGTNTLRGQVGNDTLDGGGGLDALWGGSGDDIYVVDGGDIVTENSNEGADTVRALATYTLGANVENLLLIGAAPIDGTGNELGNVLEGNAANNRLTGGAGNDTLRGYGGTDTAVGGTGDDAYSVHDTTDVIVENPNEGVDAVWASASYALHPNVENLTLVGSAAIDGKGNELANAVTGNSAHNVVDGAGGADRLAGGAGNDTYIVDNAGDAVSEVVNEGTDTVRSSISFALAENVENLTLTGVAAISATGNAGNNLLSGNDADNILTGLAGNDTFHGFGGADTLIGGAGNDEYGIYDASDVAIENANEGVDRVWSPLNYVLGANLENLILTGVAAVGTGNSLDNILTGNPADNTLTGLAGNDTLIGMAGADTMRGGVGNDVYEVDAAGDVVTENANEGTDTVRSVITLTLGANLENLTLVGTAVINGAGNALDNVLTGNDAGNTLTGLAGNDRLDGRAGADAMAGGLGDDTYVVDHAGDVVTENINEGADTVESATVYTLSANVEHLTLTGIAAINGTGNNLANMLTGNAAANVLIGREGDDTLRGQAGADTMIGGLGNDTYSVDDSGDVVTENLNEGTDTVWTAVTYTLAVNVENLTLAGSAAIDGTGNALANVLTGNAASNVLDGREGADRMIGGAGDDRYRVDTAADVIVENANEGIDLVEAPVTYTLAGNVENLTLTGTGATNGTGNDLDNVITANGAANTLVGGSGNDVLDGRNGIDNLVGGAGNDTYFVGDDWPSRLFVDVFGKFYRAALPGPRDVITENVNEGVDTVFADVSYTLSANFENLAFTENARGEIPPFLVDAPFLTGSEIDYVRYVSGTGNDLDNTLSGHSGDNWLDAGAGNDRLLGSLGNDVLRGGAGNDVLDGGVGADVMQGGPGDDTYIVTDLESDPIGGVTGGISEAPDEGVDTVVASISRSLLPNFENLMLTGGGAIDGGGNAGPNTVTGNAASNWLGGNAGADTLRGGGGNDLLNGGADADILIGESGNDVLEGMDGNDALSDSEGNNLLNAGAGTDTLTGNSGREVFIGGTGNDTISTGAGADIIAFNRGDGQDVVNASAGTDNTLSLGGGIRYADMTFSKTANDLVLNLGGAVDRITLKDWYAAPANRSVLNMQVIAEAMADFDATSTNKLVNRKLTNFDFTAMAAAYDAAGAPASWALMNELLNKHLSGSNTAALGADIAYGYGRAGNLTGMGFDPVQGLLASGSFGTAAQALQSPAALQTGVRPLS